MTIEECYSSIGADYGDVLRRFGKEERIIRFLSLLPEDGSYQTLCRALREEQAQEAFRAAHSLKGICLNLGLTTLYQSVNALTEELRGETITPQVKPMAEQVDKDYQMVVDGIRRFLEG